MTAEVEAALNHERVTDDPRDASETRGHARVDRARVVRVQKRDGHRDHAGGQIDLSEVNVVRLLFLRRRARAEGGAHATARDEERADDGVGTGRTRVIVPSRDRGELELVYVFVRRVRVFDQRGRVVHGDPRPRSRAEIPGRTADADDVSILHGHHRAARGAFRDDAPGAIRPRR